MIRPGEVRPQSHLTIDMKPGPDGVWVLDQVRQTGAEFQFMAVHESPPCQPFNKVWIEEDAL